MQGDDVCRWCEADFYRDGRCWRCGQPERTCNEVAGRSFRMTWDDRSDYSLWGDAEDDAWPRSPAFRVETATRRLRWHAVAVGFTIPELDQIIERARQDFVRAMAIPRDILFGQQPSSFAGVDRYYLSLGYSLAPPAD